MEVKVLRRCWPLQSAHVAKEGFCAGSMGWKVYVVVVVLTTTARSKCGERAFVSEEPRFYFYFNHRN